MWIDYYLNEATLNYGCMLVFQCLVTVSDNGYPSAKTAVSRVSITVTRDIALPVFTQNARYQTTIREDAAINRTIGVTVSASRQGISVRHLDKIKYQD